MPKLAVADTVSDHPVVMIVAVLVVTAVLGSVYVMTGSEMEANEMMFVPTSDVANASAEIQKDFQTIEMVQVLVRANGGNVFAPECLAEILRVEKALSENPQVYPLLMPEGHPMRMTSVAENLISVKGLLETIRNMTAQVGPQFAQVNASLDLLRQALAGSRAGIEASLGTPQLGSVVLAANNSIMDIAIRLAGLMAGSQAPGGTSGGTTALDYDGKIEMVQGLSWTEVKGLLSEAFAYDGSSTASMVRSVQAATSMADAVLGELAKLNVALSSAASDPVVSSDPRAKAAAANLQFMIPLMSGGVSLVGEMAEKLDIRTTASRLDSAVEQTMMGIIGSVTKDFSPEEGIFEAQGTLILAGFNATLARQGTNNSDALLHAAQSMEKTIKDQGLAYTTMGVAAADLTSQQILSATRSSMSILLPMAFLLIVVVLIIVYRNLSDVIVSLSALGFAVVWTYGLGTLLGFVFNPLTLAVPILLVGMGIDYGIHLTLRYREERAQGSSPVHSSHISVAWVGSALLLATVTTVVAFMSNTVSELSVIREFGILCSMGISSAFVIMIAWVPSCRQLLDSRSNATEKAVGPERKPSRLPWAARVLTAGAPAAEHHRSLVVVVTVVVTALALLAATQLETRFELQDFLPTKLKYSQDLRFILENFNVTTASSEIYVRGNISNFESLQAIEATALNMMDDTYVSMESTPAGQRPAVSSILSLMQDAADDGRIADPLDLYDGNFSTMFRSSLGGNGTVPATDIKGLLDYIYEGRQTSSMARALLHRDPEGNYDSTVMQIGIKSASRDVADALYEELRTDASPLRSLVSKGVLERASVTGSSIMIRKVLDSLQSSMTMSFIVTIVASFMILTVVFWVTEKSIVLGAITSIPVLLCSAWILGSMYLLGIAYSVMTVTVSALTIGLGITYGIHLAHRYAEEIQASKDPYKSSRESVTHTGVAIFGSAATTVAGFGLLVFSLLPPVQEFGGIVALTITYSFLATMFVLPTFLVLWGRRVTRRAREPETG